MAISSLFWRGDKSTPFCDEGKVEELILEPLPIAIDNKQKDLDLDLDNIIFRNKSEENFKPVDLTSKITDTIEYKSIEELKPAIFSPVELLPIVVPAVIEIGKKVVESISENPEPEPKQEEISSFRLEKLPIQDQDFATKWHYSTQASVNEKTITDEFNSYLQILDELDQNKVELPDGFKGKNLSNDLKIFILKDFREKNIKLNTDNNLAHRAFYAHCTKRAIDSLRQGEFRGLDGYINKRPEIADIIEKRINEIMFEKMLKN